jgi:hypothetical protein
MAQNGSPLYLYERAKYACSPIRIFRIQKQILLFRRKTDKSLINLKIKNIIHLAIQRHKQKTFDSEAVRQIRQFRLSTNKTRKNPKSSCKLVCF